MSLRIALDAGHGMNTSGKRITLKGYSDTREWWLNNRIADELERVLKNYDCVVLRVDDTTGAQDIPLETRVKKANDWKADVYISVHHNAGVNGGAGGGEMVFYYSTKTERATQAKALYDSLVKHTGLKGNRSNPVQKYPYYVLKHTNAPAFLFENGFMDSKTDVPIILTDNHALNTVDAIEEFLISQFGMKRKVTVETKPEATTNSRYEEIGKAFEKCMDDLEGLESWNKLMELVGK